MVSIQEGQEQNPGGLAVLFSAVAESRGPQGGVRTAGALGSSGAECKEPTCYLELPLQET